MNRITNKSLAAVVAVSGIFMAFCFTIMAWSEPGDNPPDSNVAAPINVGAVPQFKTGNLGIKIGTGLVYWLSQLTDSLVFKNAAGDIKMIIGQDGNVGIGVTNATQKLEVNGTVKATAFDGKGIVKNVYNWGRS